jgi:hypothetical protein
MLYDDMPSHSLSPEVEQCVQTCLDCHDMCLQTIQYLVQVGDDRLDISNLLACADLCHTSASVIQLNSQLQTQLCALCVEACEFCANDCERMAYGDPQVRACADLCRRCADSCYYMVMLPMYSVA